VKAASRGEARADEYPIERWEKTIAEAYEGNRSLDDPLVRGAVEGAIGAAAFGCGAAGAIRETGGGAE